MNQLPPLPQELGRFDSIVDAHKANDRQAYLSAIHANGDTISKIILSNLAANQRYAKQLKALNNARDEVIYAD